jgi:putative membrane protein
MPLLARWLVNALLFLVVAAVMPDSIHIAGLGTAMIIALLWGLLLVTVRPILIVLTLPVTLLTLGLFTFFINAFLFWFLAQVVKGFEVDSFGAAFLGALILSVLQMVAGRLLRRREE